MTKNFTYTFNFWIERHFGGSVSFGPVTIYGANAMEFAVNIRTKRWGSVCFKPPTFLWGKYQKPYFYASPNGTPWASTFWRGGDEYGGKVRRFEAQERRKKYGHNFDTDILFPDLYPEVKQKYPQFFENSQ